MRLRMILYFLIIQTKSMNHILETNITKFDGNHNSPRPQFYFEPITLFFHNVLNPPDVSDNHYFLAPHGSLGQGYWDTGLLNHQQPVQLPQKMPLRSCVLQGS